MKIASLGNHSQLHLSFLMRSTNLRFLFLKQNVFKQLDIQTLTFHS